MAAKEPTRPPPTTATLNCFLESLLAAVAAAVFPGDELLLLLLDILSTNFFCNETKGRHLETITITS
jgi:hypothetical protein